MKKKKATACLNAETGKPMAFNIEFGGWKPAYILSYCFLKVKENEMEK